MATIFGNLFSGDEEKTMDNNQQQSNIAQQQNPPPPPPRGDSGGGFFKNKSDNKDKPPPPPPPPPLSNFAGWGNPQDDTFMQKQQQQQDPPPPWIFPPNHEDELLLWNQQQQQGATTMNALDEYHYYQQQVNNLTSAISAMEQREELHVRQLDVLTERVMMAEAQTAAERNRLAEQTANCTRLADIVSTLKQNATKLRQQCKEYSRQCREQIEETKALREVVKEKTNQVEDMAAAIIEQEEKDEDYYNSKRRQQKKRGIFGWIISILFGEGNNNNSDEDDEKRESAIELAKSTLLCALQSERDNVHELENVVASLERNNSAICEMVDSRDLIIDELNDRVAVFEEERVVLKAALKQLQYEMQQEAPKAERVANELQRAKEDISNLKSEITTLLQEHATTVRDYQQALKEKDVIIESADTNFTTIATYVELLEERLASFAAAKKNQQDEETFSKKIQEYEQEHEELKILIRDLIQERTNLQSEKNAITKELNAIKRERETWNDKETALEETIRMKEEALEDWNTNKYPKVRDELQHVQSKNEELIKDMEEFRTVLDELQREKESILETNMELRERLAQVLEELRKLREEKEELAAKTAEMPEMPPPPPPPPANDTLQGSILQDHAAPSSPKEDFSISDGVVDRDNAAMSESARIIQAEESSKELSSASGEQAEHQGLKEPSPREMALEKEDSDDDMRLEPFGNLDDQDITPSAPDEEEASIGRDNIFGLEDSDEGRKTPVSNKADRKVPFVSVGPGTSPQNSERKVPLRGLRKFASGLTGMHGFFTPSSRMLDDYSSSRHIVPPGNTARPPKKKQKLPPGRSASGVSYPQESTFAHGSQQAHNAVPGRVASFNKLAESNSGRPK